MSAQNEIIKVTCNHGFIYEVRIEHQPHFGFSTGYYNGIIVGQVSLGKIHQPMGDNDAEWEAYEERYSEWTDEIKVNMKIISKEYFNNNKHRE